MPGEQISLDGLMHLGALTVVLTTGYLGIDKLHDGKSKLYESLDSIKGHTRNLLDLKPELKTYKTAELLRTWELYILLCVAGVSMSGMPRTIYWFSWYYKLRYIPFLGYFRRKIDRLIIALGAFIGCITFLFLVYCNLHQYYTGYLPVMLNILYVIYSAIVLVVFGTVTIAATRLRDLKSKCQQLHESLQKKKEEVINAKIGEMNRNLDGEPS